MMQTWSSLAAPGVVVTTACADVSDEKVDVMTTFDFQLWETTNKLLCTNRKLAN